MAERDCRTCSHNSYIETISAKNWFDCAHPVTLKKRPNWQSGDPQMVNYRTADVHISEIHSFKDCPAWEEHAASPLYPEK